LITNLKCETQTIKTEGILATVGIIALASTGLPELGAALAPMVPAITSGLTSAWDYIQSGLGPLLNPGFVP